MTLATTKAKSAKAKQGKYRPQLTASQITHAVQLAKLDLGCITSTTHEASLDLLATLSPFKAKIDNLAITPSYTPAPPKPSVTDSLGMDSGHQSPVTTPADALSLVGLTKEQLWEQCYQAYLTNPANCTAEQIIMAKEHMYLNDLMTPEEEEAYEQSLSEQANTGDML